MIRKFSAITLAAFALLMISSCSKDCKPKSVQSEANAMKAYAQSIGMVAQEHSSGIFYEILDPGTGNFPTINSSVAITYVGRLLNGEIFDRMDTPNNTAERPHWPLYSLIEGWQIGLPLIKPGGAIRLLIPSALAYGCEVRGEIPGNSPLFFEITLHDIR